MERVIGGVEPPPHLFPEFFKIPETCKFKSLVFPDYFDILSHRFVFQMTGRKRQRIIWKPKLRKFQEVKTGLKNLKHIFDSTLFCLSITDIFTANTSCIGGIIQLVCKTKKLFFPNICFFYSLVTSLTHFLAH